MDTILRAKAQWWRSAPTEHQAGTGVVEPHEHVDALVESVVERLRAVARPMAADELDRLAHEVVLDVTRFVLAWTEPPYDAALGAEGVAAPPAS